ncbi:MAG: helix-turn-helix transcriptional regulator, partial [Flavobacteriaceae bacterium]|nr:helix-turn-helix transcriptional regulator [Flavobacteriaceae bacterium]
GLVKEEMCSITSMYIEQDKKVYTLVSSFQTKTQGQFIEEGIITSIQSARNKPAKKFTSPNILKNEHDIEIIQQIHDYILRHLELPLPTLQVLAHNFGTNEYKLKYGFKQLYNTTVFKFLIDERLKKSNLLIENTTLSLNRIATLCGFKSIPHFSKAFKMKYGCSPSAYRNLSKWQ